MRKRSPKKRIIAPDPRFSDPLVTQFVNNLMLSGKKNVALARFYAAMDIVADKTGENAHEVWQKALINATPSVEVRSKRIGGATFQIPTEIPDKRKTSIGMKWLIRCSRARSGKGISEKLAAEVIAASKGEGSAVKRKDDTHRMADAKRALAHFK